MANRFPLIVDSSNQNIKELPDGDSLLLGDSEKLLLGDGTDLQLYHDGSNSYLANSTGALKLATESSGIAVTIGHTTSETTIGDNLVVAGDLSIGGVTLPETIADTVGAMFSSNTETGIAATYQDGDNTIDLVIGANVVVAGMIAQNSILTRHIDDNQVTTDQIAANTIATGNIADNAIDGTKIASNSILTRHIDDDQITGAQLADNIDIVGTLDVTGATTLDSTLAVAGVATAATSAKITQTALTSGSNAVAWDAAAKANAYHVTTENTTFAAPSNPVEGAIISVELAQGGTARTVAWNTVFEFAASTAPTVTATANKTDIFAFRYNGSVWQEIGRVQNMAQT